MSARDARTELGPAGRRRRLLQNLGLLLFGSLLAFGIGELLLRVTGLGSPSPMIEHGRLPFKRRPFTSFVNLKENVNEVEINNWGFHDRDRAERKSGYRFVAFGDSYVEGNQVSIDGLLTSWIERELRRDAPGVEVANAGIGGTGTAHQYLLYREFFREQIELDHALLFICNGNDLPNNHPLLERRVNGNDSAGKAYVDAAGEVFVKEQPLTLKQRALKLMDRHSALIYKFHSTAYQLKKRWRGQQDDPRSADSPPKSNELAPELEAAWNEAVTGTLRLIGEWHDELDRRAIELSIIVVPYADHYTAGNYGNPFKSHFVEQLHDLAKTREIPVLELDFSPHPYLDVYSFDGKNPGHFNYLGHRLAGVQVASWLRDAGRFREAKSLLRTAPRELNPSD